MPVHDLTNELMAHIVNMLDIQGRQYLHEQLLEMGITTGTPPEPPEIKVIQGETTVSGYEPLIRVTSANPMNTEWLATRTRKDRYTFNIDVEMRLKRKDNKDKFVMGISNAIKNWMLQWQNLASTIFQTSHTYYDSFPMDTQLGKKGEIRTARFQWWCDVCNTYVNVQLTG